MLPQWPEGILPCITLMPEQPAPEKICSWMLEAEAAARQRKAIESFMVVLQEGRGRERWAAMRLLR